MRYSLLCLALVLACDQGADADLPAMREAPALCVTADLGAVRNYLAALESRLESISTVFDEEQYDFIKAEIDADWSALNPPASQPPVHRMCRWSISGAQRALLIQDDAQARMIACCPADADAAMIWTGREWYQSQSTSRGRRIHTYSPRPRPLPAVKYLPGFNPCDGWPWFLGTHALSDYIRPSLLLGARMTDDALQLRFSSSERTDLMTITLDFSLEPELRLKVITVNSSRFNRSANKRSPGGRTVFRIDGWQSFGNGMVPARATLLQGRLTDEDNDGMAAVFITRLQRRTIEVIPDDGAAMAYFTPPSLRNGDAVLDMCYGLRYTIGENFLQVDHLTVELDDAITHRITTDLPELVGEIEKGPTGQFRKTSKRDDQSVPPSR